MSNLAKVAIVTILAVAVSAVIIARHAPSSQTRTTSANTEATTLPASSSTCCTADTGVARTDLSTTPPTTVAVPRLVDLGAGKCIPCKQMAPILEELKTEMAGKLQVEFIDVWINPNAGRTYGINIIPTQIFYDASGKELSRHEGFMPKRDILARFKEHGIDLTKVP